MVLLSNGEPVFARTLSRGVQGLPESAPALAAELRQTLVGFEAHGADPTTFAFLLGGGAAAPGALEYLSSMLGVRVEHLPRLNLEGVGPDDFEQVRRFAKAISLAVGLGLRPRDLDLRRGPLAYQRGYGFLKEKLPILSGLGAAILVSFVFSTCAELRGLSHDEEILTAALGRVTKDVLGEQTEDPEHASELLEKNKLLDEADPMPHMDAVRRRGGAFERRADEHDARRRGVRRTARPRQDHGPRELDRGRTADLGGAPGSALLQGRQDLEDHPGREHPAPEVRARARYPLSGGCGEKEEGKDEGGREGTVTLADRMERLDPRERQLVGVLVIVFGALAVLAVPLGVTALLSSRRGDNEALREAITAIQAGREAVQRRNTERDAVLERYTRPAPPLAGFLAQFAKENEIEIPESQDRAVVPHGKKYEERSTKIVLRKVGMLALVKFMERIEQSGHPVSISRLNIRKRGTEQDSYDIEMIVSAFDRKAEPKEKPEAAETAPSETP